MTIISTTLRLRLLAALAVVTMLLSGAPTAVGQSAHHDEKPTVVLLHGAFADGSSWSKVTSRLQRDGYPVVAPAVPLRGIATDTAYLRGVLDGIHGPKVLVGHSYGGALVSQLADTPGVVSLVYVAAFIPRAGETLGALSARFPGSQIGPDTTTTIVFPGGVDTAMRQDSFPAVFAADLPARRAASLAASQRPVAAAAFTETVPATAPASIPAFAVIPTRDRAIPPAAEQFMATRAGASIVEVARASHLVMLSHPAAVTRVIEEAAD
jgi:pimeloyl-ACP methyl ester carboxylesterase